MVPSMTQLKAFTARARGREPLLVPVDEDGLPYEPCAQCAGTIFFCRDPAEEPWHCTACDPQVVSDDDNGCAWCAIPVAVTKGLD